MACNNQSATYISYSLLGGEVAREMAREPPKMKRGGVRLSIVGRSVVGKLYRKIKLLECVSLETLKIQTTINKNLHLLLPCSGRSGEGGAVRL